ncbi:MAG: energy-coupling factor transporter transmembrane component T [Actinobacteria bacterium]|jgi:energy-coupling factor transport system permease protein|nr:energy-coupling factor transporter transmembrane component T [Actinomycetota bacterium]
MKAPLHPLTLWIWALLLAIGVITLNSSWVALFVVGVAVAVYLIRLDGAPWNATFWWSIRIALAIVFIRLIVGVVIGVPIPGTTLFSIPRISLPQWMPGIRIGGDVTLERLSSSAHEGLIIATLIVLFGAATALTSPHKLLRVLPIFVYEIGITLVIATSVFPQLAQSLHRIRNAQKMRGIEKISLRTIALPLLEQSLSRSLLLAESMESRGFGVHGKRSRYKPSPWNLRDSVVVLASLSFCIVMVAA